MHTAVYIICDLILIHIYLEPASVRRCIIKIHIRRCMLTNAMLYKDLSDPSLYINMYMCVCAQ